MDGLEGYTPALLRWLTLPGLLALASCTGDRPSEGRSEAIRDHLMSEFPAPLCKVEAVPEMPESVSDRPRYFPLAHLKPTLACEGFGRCIEPLSPIEFDWFTSHLRAAEEPSLLERNDRAVSSNQSFRMTVLPTFEHTVIVRIEWKQGRGRVIAKALSGMGGYEPGRVFRSIDRELTAAEAQRFSNLLALMRFKERPTALCSVGFDGTQWVYESADSSGYHLVHRWQVDGPLHVFGRYLLGLTKWPDLSPYSPSL